MNGTCTVKPASAAAFSTPTPPASTIRSARDTCLPEALKAVWIDSSTRSTAASSSGLLTSQPLCGSSRIRAPLAPPRLSLPRNDEAAAHAVETSCETDRPEARICPLSASMSAPETSSCVTAGSGSCQISTSDGTSGPR